MKRTSKKPQHKRSIRLRYKLFILLVAIGLIAGAIYYHYYEYQVITFKLSDGSNVTISRYNFNKMSKSQKQAFLSPVNYNVLHGCVGNPTDECLATPSIDFWPVGGEMVSNPDLKPSNTNPNEVMGRIVDSVGDSLELHTTSGRIITIVYPLNALSNFNDNYAKNYDITVGDGDMIYVSYFGRIQNNTIATDQIFSTSLILKAYPKLGPVKMY